MQKGTGARRMPFRDVGARCWSTGSRKKSPAVDWNPRFHRFLASGIEIGPDLTSPHSSEILILPCGTAQACVQFSLVSSTGSKLPSSVPFSWREGQGFPVAWVQGRCVD